jgi:hypothetical protein
MKLSHSKIIYKTEICLYVWGMTFIYYAIQNISSQIKDEFSTRVKEVRVIFCCLLTAESRMNIYDDLVTTARGFTVVGSLTRILWPSCVTSINRSTLDGRPSGWWTNTVCRPRLCVHQIMSIPSNVFPLCVHQTTSLLTAVLPLRHKIYQTWL